MNQPNQRYFKVCLGPFGDIPIYHDEKGFKYGDFVTTPQDLGFQDRTRAGYPVRITEVFEFEEIIRGDYWYCGKWLKTKWMINGMASKDGSYKTDVDLVPLGVRE